MSGRSSVPFVRSSVSVGNRKVWRPAVGSAAARSAGGAATVRVPVTVVCAAEGAGSTAGRGAGRSRRASAICAEKSDRAEEGAAAGLAAGATGVLADSRGGIAASGRSRKIASTTALTASNAPSTQSQTGADGVSPVDATVVNSAGVASWRSFSDFFKASRMNDMALGSLRARRAIAVR